MKVSKTVIVASAIGIGLLVGGGIFVWQRQKAAPTQPEVASETPAPPAPAMAVWKDPAGFTFSYPQDLKTNKHDEDQENYAHVELTSDAYKGSMIAWVKDLPSGATDAAGWVKKEKSFAGATVSDTTLGGKPAKRVTLSSPSKKEVIGTVFDDVLWYIELAPDDEAYWMQVFNGTIESFAFIPISDGPATSGAVGTTEEESYDDVAVDEEEVLE